MRRWICPELFSSPFPWRIESLPLPKFNFLLQNCCTSKDLGQGKKIHHQIVVRGWEHLSFVITKLIQMYADCDDISSAHLLFDKLTKPNVFAWTAVLAFYARNTMPWDCLRNFREMKLEGIAPDSYVFPKILRSCGQISSLEVGMAVHKDAMVRGCEGNLQVGNSLIHMYSKCGDPDTARKLFDKMLERNLLSWNLMISGYTCNGLHEEGIKMMNLLRMEGVVPDLVTWNAVMDAYCRLGQCHEAFELFKQIKEPNIISWTTIISGFSMIGEHAISLNLLREMMNAGRVLPDVDCISSSFISCKNLTALNNGREVHAYGIKLKPGFMFYNSAGAALLTMYSACGKIRHAIRVFEMMDKSDVVTWNAMILGFIHARLKHSAVRCFLQMQSMGTKHNHITLTTILPVCSLHHGKEIHSYIMRTHFNSSTPLMNTLIHMYSRNGCLQGAFSLFCSMISRDLVSWNAMIGGFGMHGHAEIAIKLLREMKNSGFCPNHVTFTSVLAACGHVGMVDEALDLFGSMTREYGLRPVPEHYSSVVGLLARAGRVEDAIDVVSSMPFDPDRSIWGTLLAASRAHQNFDVGKVASDYLFYLEPEHAGNYVTLSNLYARVGNWDGAVNIRKLMEDRSLVKPSAYSCI